KPARFCHFSDGQQAALAEPVEPAPQCVSLSNISDCEWCQRQTVACLEPFCIQDSGGISVIVIVQRQSISATIAGFCLWLSQKLNGFGKINVLDAPPRKRMSS